MHESDAVNVIWCGTADGVRSVLEAAGFRVTTLVDCSQVLRDPRAPLPQLVVFDADEAPIGLLDNVSRVATHPTVLVVVVSRDRSPEHIVAAMQAGAADYIVKDPSSNYPAALPERLRRLPVAAASESSVDLARRFHRMARELSHDIRNPVGNVLGYVELLRDNPSTQLSKDQAHFLDRISENCTLVLDLIKEFTNTAKALADPR